MCNVSVSTVQCVHTLLTYISLSLSMLCYQPTFLSLPPRGNIAMVFRRKMCNITEVSSILLGSVDPLDHPCTLVGHPCDPGTRRADLSTRTRHWRLMLTHAGSRHSVLDILFWLLFSFNFFYFYSIVPCTL